eukprot:3701957-Alexandrium_andersonii.AAC.1
MAHVKMGPAEVDLSVVVFLLSLMLGSMAFGMALLLFIQLVWARARRWWTVEAEPRPAYPTAPAATGYQGFVRNPVHEQSLPRKQDQACLLYTSPSPRD